MATIEEQDGVRYHIDGRHGDKPTHPHRTDTCSPGYCGRTEWADAKKLEVIGYVLDRHEAEMNDRDGDKYLTDPSYFREAISAVLADDYGRLELRTFLDQSEPEDA